MSGDDKKWQSRHASYNIFSSLPLSVELTKKEREWKQDAASTTCDTYYGNNNVMFLETLFHVDQIKMYYGSNLMQLAQF